MLCNLCRNYIDGTCELLDMLELYAQSIGIDGLAITECKSFEALSPEFDGQLSDSEFSELIYREYIRD